MKKIVYFYVVFSWLFITNVFGKGVDCSTNCFESEILSAELTDGGCTQYEILVKANGDCAHALSHYSIGIPECAEIQNVSNSSNWKVEYGNDPKTGINGFKIDEISGFGESSGEFTVTYTLCQGGCSEELSCFAPEVAYKAATCVYYEQIDYSCSNLEASLNVVSNTCGNGTDGSIEVVITDGNEPFNFVWSNGASSQIIENLANGSYSVVITDGNGESLELSAEITSPEAIQISFDISDASCEPQSDGAVTTQISGGVAPYSYSWSTGETTESLSSVRSGYYVLTVTDANNCTVSEPAIVQNSVFIGVVAQITNTGCSTNNGAIDITVDSGQSPYTFLWSNGETTEDISRLAKGAYSVTVTDANGCGTSRSYSVNENNPLRISANTSPTACVEDNSGAIDITMIGGLEPYSYSWSTGETTEDISGLAAGIYTLTVADSSGCSVTSSFNVTTNTFNASSMVTQPSCSDSNDGRIELIVSAGTAPYSYQWSSGDSTSIIENLSPGPYSVTIEDAAGCSKTLSYFISAPQPLNVAFSVSNPACADGDFEITASGSGGTGPYTYEWENGSSGNLIVDLDSGYYAVTVTDAKGCSVTGEAQASFTLVTCDDGTGDDGTGDDGTGDDGTGDDGSDDNGSGDDGSDDDGSGGDGDEQCFNPFDTEIELLEQNGDCYTYKALISYNGSHVHGLSHLTIEVACGSIGDVSNSNNWKIEQGNDPTTGLNGIKIDNINEFGEGDFADVFEVEFTICSSEPACIDEMNEGFTVAYKYGQCVSYEDQAVEANLSERMDVNVYPNPFYSTSTIEFYSPVSTSVKVDIMNRQGVIVRQLYSGMINDNETKEFKFDATGLPSDIYTYRILTQFGVKYGKILLAD